jgi:porphobilinogen synthase
MALTSLIEGVRVSSVLGKLCPAVDAGSESPVGAFPAVRPRRLRTTAAMRRMVAEVRVHPADLVHPMFVREGLADPRPIGSLPGIVQHSRESLLKAAAEAVSAGVGGIMLFGIPSSRDEIGSAGTDPDGILNAALRDVRAEVGDAIVLMGDLCLDEFTSHGHCGVLTADGRVDNDATLLRYAEMAVVQADAGAHMLGLSGMMDGQVAVVRAALDAAGHTDIALLAYAAKYASAFYGPFRDAVESALEGDRRTYQQDPPNAAESLREVALDVAEGADIVMVKPALPYLDIVSAVASQVTVPVAAYQVSGEYAMVEAAAANGWIDRERVMLETLTSIRRAGAGVIATYWATEAARLLTR